MVKQVPSYLLAVALLSGCSGHGQRAAPQATTVPQGFRVFQGDCINGSADNVSPLLIPLISSLVSGGLKAIGSNIKKYGEDSDAKFASTVNFEAVSEVTGCIHVVHGPVLTDREDFKSVQLEHLLPLPWDAMARAAAPSGSTAQELAEQRRKAIEGAKTALEHSGAMLAGRPNFFAELRAHRSKDKTQVAFRLRSIYYGSKLSDGWFARSEAKALVITIAPFDASKSLLDSLKSGYSVQLSDVVAGTAWVSADLLYAGKNTAAWDTPWYALPSDATKPFTLITGVLETTAGSKLLGVLGSALEESAETTASKIADRLDADKVATAAASEKAAQDKARNEAAASVTTAVDSYNTAKDAFDTCVAMITAAGPLTSQTITKPQRDVVTAFLTAKVTAAAAIASAEPLFATLQLPTSFLSTTGTCAYPR